MTNVVFKTYVWNTKPTLSRLNTMRTQINPFRYSPTKEVIQAADSLIEHIKQSEHNESFSEGKMLGIMIVKPHSQEHNEEIHYINDFHYIAAFSGNVGGNSIIKGFVPPIYNLLDKDGHFKKEEANISKINTLINEIQKGEKLLSLKSELQKMEAEYERKSLEIRDEMSKARADREKTRAGCNDSIVLARLINESQNEKASFRRFKKEYEQNLNVLLSKIQLVELEINALKLKRSQMSENLQNWIFRHYIIHNFSGEESNIYEVFKEHKLIPPGGSGDCAAVKLFEYAIQHKLEPLALGEFWYGKSPEGPVRNHGDFYPACTNKCGIILPWMMRGLYSENNEKDILNQLVDIKDILFEDEYLIVVNKQAGVPSVPGLDGQKSLIETLQEQLGVKLFVVHRLDMDTSGLIIYAKSQETASIMQAQFENRSIKKTYRARLRPTTKYDTVKDFKPRDNGEISLPLSPIYEDRPRQMVDFNNGKEAITKYEIEKVYKDGSIDVLFYPETGRTHQLRVHAAHHLGLGRPILGDKLYGGSRTENRLMLEACQISFAHPVTNVIHSISSISEL